MRYYGVTAASYLVWLLVAVTLVHPALMDVRVYRAEGAALLDGLDPYGPLAGVHGVNTYPPFAALVFVPAALLPVASVEVLSVVVNLVLLLVVSWQSVRLVRGHGSIAAACVLAAVAVWAEPVTTSISYGQINLALLALVLWDLTLPPGSRWHGVGVGLATALKVTPGVLVVYLLLTGRVRAALTAGVTFVATIVLTALVDAHATWSYWTGHLFDTDRVGRLENSANQSLRGWLVRAFHTRDVQPVELVVAGAALLAGLAVAVYAHRYLGDAWGLCAAAITGLLVSPISWSHHWVWCVPILALLWYEARAFVVPALAVLCSYAVWLVPHGGGVELHLDGLQVAASGWYVVLGAGFLVLAAVRARRVQLNATPACASSSSIWRIKVSV